MSKLSKLDNAAESKGAGIKTLWQFVKFIFVSLIAFVIQIFLPLLIKLPMSDEFLYRPYDFWIFHNEPADPVTGVIVAGLGVFIAANVSNIIAQIVSFFINRDKTFNSSANVAVTLPIYIVFTIALICFSAWLSPTLITFLEGKNIPENAAISISGAICGAIQFFLYFPVDKILFRKPKEKKEDETDNTEEAPKA